MKTTFVLSFILAAGLAQAAPRMNFSTKTGMPLDNSDGPVECPLLNPIRKVNITVDFTQILSKTNPDDGSTTFEDKLVCQNLKGVFDVYDVPQDIPCYSTEQSPSILCKFSDSDGLNATASVWGGVRIRNGQKSFTAILSTLQPSQFHYDYNSATVFDVNLEKLILNVQNKNLESNSSMFSENLMATVLFEDLIP